ncbi:hypothetical protein OG563_40600 [Nocardia vinacea]|uniref:Uncharacterized protein n=1 Tax=Nocardia vinacea TaxID=96468 RepID=A0ABZ1YQ27_9NOCA|nr:hypothetical protein [Nocardia vinacea]
MSERHLGPVTNPMAKRVRDLTERAGRAGYRLVGVPDSSYKWWLLDAEDREPIHSAATLDQIEQWLDE